MKHIFIVNSLSANKRVLKVEKNIEKVCKQEKLDYEIEYIRQDNHVSNILPKYLESENIIHSVGGDGTINHIVNMIVNTANILSVIPIGTGNDFYKTAKELDKLYNKIDIGKINDKYFINTACFGIDADVANNTKMINANWIPLSQRYNASLVYTFFKYKNKELEVIYKDGKKTGKFTTVAICNGRYYGGGFKIAPNALLVDGLFDIYIAENIKKRKLLSLVLKLKKGEHERKPEILKVQTDTISIKSREPLVCNIDGESIKGNEFNISILKQRLMLYNNKELISKILDV